MIPDPRDPGLSRDLPLFRRARDFRLYDERGRRYLDLWQAGGHAILGHRSAGVSTLMKNAISRGLVADLPSRAAERLARCMRSLLPTHPFVRIYTSLRDALDALSASRGGPVEPADILDPAVAGERVSALVAWRPFVPFSGYPEAEAIIPVLPFAACGGPWLACLREEPAREVPPSQAVSPFLLEGAARALAGVRRYVPGPLGPRVAGLGRAAWSVSGVYVSPRFPRERYAEVFHAFLRSGVVLSPCYESPSILPAQLSEGEMRLTLGLFRSNPAQ